MWKKMLFLMLFSSAILFSISVKADYEMPLSMDIETTINNNFLNTTDLGCTEGEVPRILDGIWACYSFTNSSFVYNDLDIAWANTLGFGNISLCAEGEILKITGGVWACGTEAAATGNTSAQMIAAINKSQAFNIQARNVSDYIPWSQVTDKGINIDFGNVSNKGINLPWENITGKGINLGRDNLTGIGITLPWGNITGAIIYNISYEWFLNNTIFLTFNATYDAKPSNTFNSTYDLKPSNTFNATYDANLDTANTSSQMIAAINQSQTYNIRARNVSDYIQWSQITDKAISIDWGNVSNKAIIGLTQINLSATFLINKDNVSGGWGVNLGRENLTGIGVNLGRDNITGIGVNLPRANLTGIGTSNQDFNNFTTNLNMNAGNLTDGTVSQNKLISTFLINKDNISGGWGVNLGRENITGIGVNLPRANLTGIGASNLDATNFTANLNLNAGNLTDGTISQDKLISTFLINKDNVSGGWGVNLGRENITGIGVNLPRANLTGIGTSNQDFNNFTTNLAMKWENLSTFNLNSAWTGTLGFKNLTNYDFNVSWSNTLGGGNITHGTLDQDTLTSTFLINKNNISGAMSGENIPWANITGKGINLPWANITGSGINLDWTTNITNKGINLDWANITGKGLTLDFATNITNKGIPIIEWANVTNKGMSGLTASNFTANLAMKWENLSTFNLDSVWAGTLGFKNLTKYDLNVSWTNTLGYGNLSLCAEGEILKISSSVWACSADATGGAGGANYWQIQGDWMTPNITAGGKNLVNATGFNASQTSNASVFWENGVSLEQKYKVAGGINLGRDNLTGIGVNLGRANVTGIGASNLDFNNFTTNLGMRWENLSTYNLNSAWSNTLSWKNLTAFDFNVSWLNSLHGGNITHGTLDQDALTATFLINKNNISGAMGGENIPRANITGIGASGLTTSNFTANLALDFKNLTKFDFNVTWLNTLHGGNITAGTISQDKLTSTFMINKNNVSGSFGGENIPRANITGIGAMGLSDVNLSATFNINWGNISNKGINLPWDNITGKGLILDFATNITNKGITNIDWANVTNKGMSGLTASNFTASLALREGNISVGANWDIGAYNLTANGFKIGDDERMWMGADLDVFMMYNTTANAGQLG